MANEDVLVVRELRERSEAELASLLKAKRDDLQKIRFNKALGQLQQTHTVKTVRRDIARLNTILTEKRKGQEA